MYSNKDLVEAAIDIQEQCEMKGHPFRISFDKALELAQKRLHDGILCDAFVVTPGAPSALEKIAMKLESIRFNQ